MTRGLRFTPCLIAFPNTSFNFKVTVPNLRIRKDAGTGFDYHKKGGKPVYTGEGVFTIVKTKEGNGAKLWGLLKSYEKDEDGWIALDEEFGKKC